MIQRMIDFILQLLDIFQLNSVDTCMLNWYIRSLLCK